MLPRIALTLGDVAGIGPEIVVRAWCEAPLLTWCRPVVVGHPEVLRRAIRTIGADLDVCPVAGLTSDLPSADKPTICCWNPSGDEAVAVPAGNNDPRAGRAAYEYLVAATEGALAGEIDAITTAPVSKAALHLAGLKYPGHTEILAEICGVLDFAMMLY